MTNSAMQTLSNNIHY